MEIKKDFLKSPFFFLEKAEISLPQKKAKKNSKKALDRGALVWYVIKAFINLSKHV